MGCRIKATVDGKTVTEVLGNTCKRGEEYARSECVNPVRIITTTVLTQDNDIIPVKTDKPIPRKKICELMDAINVLHPSSEDIFVGSIICKNILNTGANIVVTAPLRDRKC